MFKKLIAVAILAVACASAHAQTVSMTITASTADYNSYATMCGTLGSKVDAQTPPQPRSCNATEVKAFINNLILRPYYDWRGAQLNKAAVDAVVVPSLSFATN